MKRSTIQIKILHNGNNESLPFYATEQSAGMDLRAAINENITLESLDRVAVPTGIAIALEAGYEAQIRPRSGLAAKHGISVINAPGTIDADYRGEIMILLVNCSKDPFIITPGMRIAQMVIAEYVHAEIEEVSELSDTARGTGGFGSTGLK